MCRGRSRAVALRSGGSVDSQNIKEAYRERMVKIYEQHNPSKVTLGIVV